MRTELQEKLAMYRAVNDITLQGEIVVFGSSFMANFPFYEMSKRYVMQNAVYNRSIDGLTLAEAESILNEAVLDIKPSKLFLSLGEMDIRNPSALTVYGRILRTIKRKLPKTKVYVLAIENSTLSENDGGVYEFNQKLRALANEQNAEFLELPAPRSACGTLYEKIFKRLNSFFQNSRLTMAEAFSFAD